MLKTEFYERLKGTRNKIRWSVNKYGEIRGKLKNGHGNFCPITSVSYTMEKKGLNDVGAADELGREVLHLRKRDVDAIMEGADSRLEDTYAKVTRLRLLDALGLKEEA